MLCHAQGTFSGDALQLQMNAAINAGQSSFLLPNGTIQLTTTFSIPRGTSNFTLSGQPLTKFVRASNADFPLLSIGVNESGAFSNTALAQYPQFPVNAALEGTSTLTVPSGVTVPPGWYVIAGVHPTNDLVRNSLTSGFNYKRELIHVNQQLGTTLILAEGIGRNFETPSLFQIELDTSPVVLKKVCSNISIVNVAIDGRLGDITTGRTIPSKAPQVSKLLTAGLNNNLLISNVRVSGFSSSGISLLLNRGTTVSNCQISDGNMRYLGYGIEVAGCRFTTIQNCTMQDTRLGSMFQCGSMDSYVFNCIMPSGRGNFDVGHGQDERRITYDSCRADQFTISNQSWLRGIKGATLINCSAYRQILIQGGAKDVLISGKHPLYSVTAPQVFFATDANSNGLPAGPVWPESVQFQSAVIGNTFYPGRTLYYYSGTGQVPRLGTVTFSNSTLNNPYVDGVDVIDVGALTGTGVLRFENCQITASSPIYAPFIANSTGTGTWDFTASNCDFVSPSSFAGQINPGANGIYRFLGSRLNGAPLTSSMVANNSGGSATVTIGP